MITDDINKEIQDWILAEEQAGRSVDIERLNERLNQIISSRNRMPCDDFDGLSPEEMHNIIYNPFGNQCVVRLNTLTKEQYERMPLVRQTLFLLNALGEKELKLTKLGWLPLKIVAEAYALGQPEYLIEEFEYKRINEYDAKSVWMARIILELLRWVKMRKGVLSLTAKGKKALSDIDSAANEIFRISLTGMALHALDGGDDNRIGNLGMAYSVWLLNKYGSKWEFGDFYQYYYQMVFNFPDKYNIYAIRVFARLFYWLGLVETMSGGNTNNPLNWKFMKSDLFQEVFSFKEI